MFEERWNTEKFWLEWRSLPNRNNFTINNYDFTCINSGTKLELSCLKCKKSFDITVRRFFEWKKCIFCYPIDVTNASIGEVFITNFLIEKKITFVPQAKFASCKNIRPLPFDFYLPKYRMLIELQGGHHLKPHAFGKDKSEETKIKNLEKVQTHDSIKRQWAKDNQYTLVELFYSDLDNLEIVLFYHINRNLNNI